MSKHFRRRGVGLAAALVMGLNVAHGQGVTPIGGEFLLQGTVKGDQVWPSLALTSSNGIIAWQDNIVDGVGAGIGAAKLDFSLLAQRTLRVNKVATGDQILPQVAQLRGGNTIFVWQSSVTRLPAVYARLAKGTNFYTADIRVNTDIRDQRTEPAVAGLADGGAIIAWTSYDGHFGDVYARKVTAAGTGATAKEFLVNQYTSYNQHHPAVAALANGNYVVLWVSESERFPTSVDVYGRIYSSAGVPATGEFLINSGTNLCESPAVAPLANGGFAATWSQANTIPFLTNGIDIWGRAFSANGTPVTRDFRINEYLYGDQVRPKIASGPNGCLVVWTSLGQDGSREGVFGRYLLGGSQFAGGEFRVNTTVISQQIHPAVAWNGVDRFLVVWSSFTGVSSGFDLFGQAYGLKPTP